MSGNVNNILHGPCTVYVDGVDVGYTQGGVSVRKNMDLFDVEADQAVGVVTKKVQMEKMTLSTTMLESTLANMKLAMSEPASNTATAGTTLILGCSSPTVLDHTVTLIGVGPSSQTRRYTFYRAMVAEQVEHPFGARSAVSVLPLALELLKDSSHNETFGYFVDS